MKASFLVISLLALSLSGCSMFERKNSAPPTMPTSTASESTTATADETLIQTPEQAEQNPPTESVHHTENTMPLVWGYSGVIGPEMWHKLDSSFKLCGSGKNQSPIDLKWSRPKEGGQIETHYNTAAFDLVDDGHSLMVSFPDGGTANIRGKNFTLRQAYFHSSSEHNIAGNSLPMEVQLIHTNEAGEIAILSAILIEGQHNPALQEIWSRWPGRKMQTVNAQVSFNPAALLPEIKTHYAYNGSLTIPPCTEGVSWSVFNTPLELSREQLLAFRHHYSSNNRPLQKLNGRKVTNY